MTVQAEFNESQAKELLSKSPDQLYELLGLRIKAVEEDIGVQGTFVPRVAYSTHMGSEEELKKIGKRMLAKVHVQAYGLVCGSESVDEEDREKIIDALGIGTEAAAVALAAVLVSSFGIAAAFAGVLAALIIKRFAVPVIDEGRKGMCELWKEHLPASPAQ